jgi:hypothetical protein
LWNNITTSIDNLRKEIVNDIFILEKESNKTVKNSDLISSILIYNTSVIIVLFILLLGFIGLLFIFYLSLNNKNECP